MLSYQDQWTMAQNLSQDNSSDAKTFFKQQINIGQHILETELGSFYTEETGTITTVAGTNSYATPDQFIRLKQAYVTVNSIRYEMQEVYNEKEWQMMIASQTQQRSDIATHCFIRRDRIEVYPTPSSSSNTITLIYEASGKDLYNDDYTTGTITTLAANGTAVTGSGTTFTSGMVGRYFKINTYPIWYKIATYTSATAIALDKGYTGTAISAGSSAFTIGEMPRTPESTHHIPVYYSLMQYFQGFKLNENKGNYYKALYDGDMKRAKVTFARRYSSNYIPGRRSLMARPINPNLYPSGMTY